MILLTPGLLATTFATEPVLTPERVKSAVEKLPEVVTQAMTESEIPGIAVAVVFRDEVVFAEGFGVREAGKPERVDADTVFQLASVSKPIGATVVAAAVGDGTVSWDSRISDLDPAFAMHDPWVTSEITVRDFYSHRSGLPDHAGDLLEDIGFSRAEILHRLRYQEPDSSFRSHYAYTNFGMTEAAIAVAKAAGKSWEDLSEDRLYRPLGMTSTSSRHADFLTRENRALGHIRQDDRWVHAVQRDPDAQSPAGGVSSSVNDLTKWMRLQLSGGQWDGKPLIEETALAESHHPHMLTGFSRITGAPGFYGLGWNVGYDSEGRLHLSHSGAFELGAATAVYLIPSEQLGIVILTNAAPIGVAEAIGMTFLDNALRGESPQDWMNLFGEAFAQMRAAENAQIADYSVRPASPTPPAPLENYTGIYRNDFFGDLEVAKTEDNLILKLGPQKQSHPLEHWDRDAFTYESETETLRGPSGVFFNIGPGGNPASVTVENLNRQDNGSFRRIKSTP